MDQPRKKQRLETLPMPACELLRLSKHEVALPQGVVLSPGAHHGTRVALAVGAARPQRRRWQAAGGKRKACLHPCSDPACSVQLPLLHEPTVALARRSRPIAARSICACPLCRTQALPAADAPAYEAFLASGRRVYSLRAPRAGAFSGERGKEGVHIAEAGPGVAAHALDPIHHRAEVQHLALHEQPGAGPGSPTVLASVDCYGRAVLAEVRRGGGEGGGQPGGGLHVTAVHQLQPTDVLRCGDRCLGWS